MQKNNPIVDNWINTNTTKLLEIRNENVELYDTVISTLAYLNNYLGSENKEALINIPEPKFKVGDLVNRNTPTIRYEVLSYSYNPTSKEYFYNLSRLSDRQTILEKEINLIEAEEIPHQSILETAPKLPPFKKGDIVKYIDDNGKTYKVEYVSYQDGQYVARIDEIGGTQIIGAGQDEIELVNKQLNFKVGDTVRIKGRPEKYLIKEAFTMGDDGIQMYEAEYTETGDLFPLLENTLELAIEQSKFKVGDFVTYSTYNFALKITKLNSGNGQFESVMANGTNPNDIIYLVPDRTQLLPKQPKFKVGDAVVLPKTQFGLPLKQRYDADILIKEAEAFGYELVVLNITYNLLNNFNYWLGFKGNSASAKVPFEEADLVLFEEAPTLKNFKIQTFNNEETSKLFDYLVDNNLIKTYRTSQNAVFSNELIDSIKNNSSVISERYFVITEDSELISPSETIFEEFEMPQYTLQELGISKPYIDYVDRGLDSTKFIAKNFNEAKEIIELLTTYRYNGKTIKFEISPNVYTRHKYFAITPDYYLVAKTEKDFYRLGYAELDLVNFLNVAPTEQIEVLKTPKKRVAKQKNIIPLQENKQKPAEQVQSKAEQSDFDDLLDELDNLEF